MLQGIWIKSLWCKTERYKEEKKTKTKLYLLQNWEKNLKQNLKHKQTRQWENEVSSTESKARKWVILVCSLGAVASHHSLFPVSYRWRSESDYKGCHPSGPPAHVSKTQTEREKTAVKYIQTEETRWQWESITLRWLRPQTFGGQCEGEGGHLQLPKWRRNLLGCCGSCWVQRGASKWRWRVCGQSIGSPFAYQCHGARSIAGQSLTEEVVEEVFRSLT